MSQSPLARKRKSLTAFSRAPSQLSRSVSTLSNLADIDSSPPSSSQPADQNAFATPTRERKPRRESRRESDIRDSPRQPSPTRYRSSGAGGAWDSPADTPGKTPHRIIYSPYATPPAGLSRSSSIPFDMAASAAAARKTEERLRAAAGNGNGGPSTPGGAKKQRFVRRKALWQR